MNDRPTVVVVGSIHLDLIATGPRLPRPGESVLGDGFTTAPGGKGGKQARQLALAGCRTYFIGRVGDDRFGRRLRNALEAKGVLADYLSVDGEAATGVSPILSAGGEYISMIVPGAAARLTADDLDSAMPVFSAAKAVVLQLELPSGMVRHAAALARRAGARVVLNVSPLPAEPDESLVALLSDVDVAIVNRHEAARLGADVDEPGHELKAARSLRETLGVAMAVITLGDRGAVAATATEGAVQSAFPVSVRDTVGAGDAFLGAFVASLVRGRPLGECLRWGVAAGALAVTRPGADEALPDADEIAAFLAEVDPGRG